jgi:hypothetical protein
MYIVDKQTDYVHLLLTKFQLIANTKLVVTKHVHQEYTVLYRTNNLYFIISDTVTPPITFEWLPATPMLLDDYYMLYMTNALVTKHYRLYLHWQQSSSFHI